MVELLDATTEDRSELAKQLSPVQADGNVSAWLKVAIQEKTRNVTTFSVNGEKLACVWWWFSPTNKTLVLNGGCSFQRTKDVTPAMMDGYLQLAKKVGAVAIELTTRRPGLIRRYMKEKWTVEGVLMRLIP